MLNHVHDDGHRREGTGIKEGVTNQPIAACTAKTLDYEVSSRRQGRRRKKNPAPPVIVPVATGLDSSDTAPSTEIAGIDDGRNSNTGITDAGISPTVTMDTLRDKENLEVQTTDALMNCQKKKNVVEEYYSVVFGWIVVVCIIHGRT